MTSPRAARRAPRGGQARLGRRSGPGRSRAGSRSHAGRGRWSRPGSRSGRSPRPHRARAPARGLRAPGGRRRHARHGRGARPRSRPRSRRGSGARRLRAGHRSRPPRSRKLFEGVLGQEGRELRLAFDPGIFGGAHAVRLAGLGSGCSWGVAPGAASSTGSPGTASPGTRWRPLPPSPPFSSTSSSAF